MAAAPSRLERVFRRIVAMRWPVLAGFALLVPLGALEASRIRSDGAISSMVVASDPDFEATRAFQRIFPEGQLALLIVEDAEPWRNDVLAMVDAVAAAARRVQGVTVYSPLNVYRQAHPGFAPDARGDRRAAPLRRVGRPLPQAGAGRRAPLGARRRLPRVRLGRARRDALQAIDAGGRAAAGGSWTEHAPWCARSAPPTSTPGSSASPGRPRCASSPSSALFVVALALFLYRSVRSLLAILLVARRRGGARRGRGARCSASPSPWSRRWCR